VGIVEELVEIWPNEVCDRTTTKLTRRYQRMMFMIMAFGISTGY